MEHVGDTPGLAPIVHDVSLTRGIPVRGRLIDQVSRRPVRGVVHYFLLDINPRYDELRWSLCAVPGAHRRRRLVLDRRPGRPGVAGRRRALRPVHQGRRRRSIQGGGEIRLYNNCTSPPQSTRTRRYFDTLVELDLPADSSGVERTIELIPSK